MKMLNWKRLAAAVCFATALVGTAVAQSASRSAEEMLAEINGIQNPTITREIAQDPAKVKEYREAVAKANRDRSELILAFYKAYPDHAETPKLLYRRWSLLKPMISPLPKDSADAIRADVDAILATSASEEVTKMGKYMKARVGMLESYGQPEKMIEAADEFAKAYPSDGRGGALLEYVASSERDRAKRLELYERIVRDYPNAPEVKYAKGKLRQTKELGQPFAMSFTDAVTGKKVDMADYKGKVVVIDFWATWCGPCIQELPKMKKLYADYKDKGLEIVSISLDLPEDKGGLTKLRDFVSKNDMPWAHYYQGGYWDSEFSKSWGINAIPALFLIDRNGNLVDIEARQGIEDRVKALLEK